MLSVVLHNVNFKNKKTGDCVVRAVAEAASLPYKEAARMLFDEWMRTGYEMTDNKCVTKVLETLGFVKMKKPFKPTGHTYMAKEMDEVMPAGSVAVVQVANHLTCVKGGSLIDTWDCSRKSVYGYWVKERSQTCVTDSDGKQTKARIEL